MDQRGPDVGEWIGLASFFTRSRGAPSPASLAADRRTATSPGAAREDMAPADREAARIPPAGADLARSALE
jgi:hypothetical protein